MRLLGLVLVLALALTACNQTDTTKNQIKDNNTNTTNVSNETNRGQAIGKEYGGKGTGYGQVKKIEPGQATPPIAVAPQTLLQKVDAYSMKHLGVHTTSVELIKSDSNGVGIEYKIVFDNWNRGWDLWN
ncbi:hypothetical protein ACFFIX_26125 [Metabacillus herbersteinensis]|uniref:Lipoprotein n=1 Tax=Metabacillus herbersteinensis TaxID=283816 RepID=A0ABV6GM71_9BACI